MGPCRSPVLLNQGAAPTHWIKVYDRPSRRGITYHPMEWNAPVPCTRREVMSSDFNRRGFVKVGVAPPNRPMRLPCATAEGMPGPGDVTEAARRNAVV